MRAGLKRQRPEPRGGTIAESRNPSPDRRPTLHHAQKNDCIFKYLLKDKLGFYKT